MNSIRSGTSSQGCIEGEIKFLVGVQPFATTLFGVPIPLPTPQGRRAQQFKTRPEYWIRGLHEASTQGTEATSANLYIGANILESGIAKQNYCHEIKSSERFPSTLPFLNASEATEVKYLLSPSKFDCFSCLQRFVAKILMSSILSCS